MGPAAFSLGGPAMVPALSELGLRSLFTEQHRLLNHFFEWLDYGQVARFCNAAVSCTGTLLFTGVGKSGHVAAKIAATYVSLGIRARYLNVTDALHGDVGMVDEDDLLIMLSKSGSSEELLRLAPCAKARGARLAAITCLPGSPLEAAAAVTVRLPLARELCPHDLAPVTSAALQTLFGDTLAVALMQARGLTREQYAANHPAGRIGRRLTLRVDALMLAGTAVPLVQPGTSVGDALVELSSKGCGCVLVARSERGARLGEATAQLAGDAMDGVEAHEPQPSGAAPPQAQGGAADAAALSGQHAAQAAQPRSAAAHEAGQQAQPRGGAAHEARPQQLLGIFTDGDLRRALQRHGGALLGMCIEEVMTPTPRVCSTGMLAADAMELMAQVPKVAALPVLLPCDGQSSGGGGAAAGSGASGGGGPCGTESSTSQSLLVGLITLHALVSSGL